MATVYLGTDTRLDRVIALKIAHPELSDDAEFVRRFIGEGAPRPQGCPARNVVAIFDQGSDKRPALHSDGVRPGPNAAAAAERARQAERQGGARHHGGACSRGWRPRMTLASAHRDVKPEKTCCWLPRGAVKVADFGLARSVAGTVQTKGGMIIGTAALPGARAGLRAGTSDARTDVYAAGIMLFELLTGFQPHTGERPAGCRVQACR